MTNSVALLGHGFPLTGTCCVIGRQETADIRVSSADGKI